MALVDGAVHTVRSLREKFKLEPKAKPALVLVCKTEDARKTLQLGAQVCHLTRFFTELLLLLNPIFHLTPSCFLRVRCRP